MSEEVTEVKGTNYKKRVALYLRYSSDKQTEQSIEGQQRVCQSFCDSNNYKIVDIYIDRALSASKHTDKRTEFLRMIKDSEKHLFDAVVVYKLDRFARNRYDAATYKTKLKKNGVSVISATEPISESPEGIILEAVLEGMAEFYSAELAQKVKRGMNETALKCNSCGGSIPLGYKIENKKYVLDPVTAPIVREAFLRYADGETITSICTDFNNRGFLGSKGHKFNKNSFASMFSNEKYIGIYRYNDIRVENAIPAIIDKETFRMVAQRKKSNTRAPARTKAKTEYLLAQKLFCGHCDSPMTGECGQGRNGSIYYYYTCAQHKRFHTCDKQNVPKDEIEQFVIDKTVELLRPDVIEELADMAVSAAEKDAAENKNIPALQAEINSTQRSINNLLKLVEHGSESESLFKRLDELEAQKKSLEYRLAEENNNVIKLNKPQVVWWLTKFVNGDKNDPTFCKQLLDMLVNSVTVWDDPDDGTDPKGKKQKRSYRVTIIFNLTSNNTQTYRCSDLTESGSPKKKHPNNVRVFLLVL